MAKRRKPSGGRATAAAEPAAKVLCDRGDPAMLEDELVKATSAELHEYKGKSGNKKVLRLMLRAMTKSVMRVVKQNIELGDDPRAGAIPDEDLALKQQVQDLERQVAETAARVSQSRKHMVASIRQKLAAGVSKRVEEAKAAAAAAAAPGQAPPAPAALRAVGADPDSVKQVQDRVAEVEAAAASLPPRLREVSRQAADGVLAGQAALAAAGGSAGPVPEVEKVLAGKKSATAKTPSAGRRRGGRR